MKNNIEIHGMSCSHCEEHIRKELKAISGVKSAKANAAKKKGNCKFIKRCW